MDQDRAPAIEERDEHPDRRERLIREGRDGHGDAGMARHSREGEHGAVVFVGPSRGNSVATFVTTSKPKVS